MLWKARRKLIYEKAEHHHKEYKQMYRTEIRMARMTRKVINFYTPVESNWHLLSGSEVSMVWAQRSGRCGSFFASIRSSVAPVWSSTWLQLTCWGLWNHMLHRRGTQTWSKWIDQQAWLWQKSTKIKLRWQIMHWLLNLVVNVASSAWRIWFTRSHTVENHFKEANNFPWPFKSSSPWGGMKKKTTPFKESWDPENREDQINRPIRKIS